MDQVEESKQVANIPKQLISINISPSHVEDTSNINCYNSVILKLIKKENLVLELTQENTIESSVQDCLPYIPQTTGLCTTLAHSVTICLL